MKLVLFCSFATATILLVFLAHLVIADPKPLQLTVRPGIGFEPLSVRVELRVHPLDQDRIIRVEANGGDFERSSEWTIEGSQSPVLYSWIWPDCLAGEYTVYAAIGDGRQWRARTSQPLTVLAR